GPRPGARLGAHAHRPLPRRAPRPVDPRGRRARSGAHAAVSRRARGGPRGHRLGHRRSRGHLRRRRNADGLPRGSRPMGGSRPRCRDRGGARAGRPRAPARAPGSGARARVEGDAMPLRFGVHIPTCIEGMMYPVPFARPQDILPVALLAERVGFDSVWGNDHMTTQRYVQREWPEPPNFYEPLITFTYVAARTERIRLATGIIVLPMRTMPVLAKQVATLDQLSGGRVILGVGTGAYREEYEALHPDARDARRGDIVDEGMRALRLDHRHRAAVRVLARPHARGGGDALPRLAALPAPGVAEALHAARADGRLRAAQPHRQPGRDLRADPRVPAGGCHHALGPALRGQHRARDAGGDRPLRARGHPQLQVRRWTPTDASA